ncbi:DUF2306 domain-containing protein [Kordia jejudonensis]|uniref:DUF2306 domain-containing protein n=1 Tax=Kordia jejudonensis TaxID=1348245 RepID=UPI0006293F21|nr:DUF2306 domain-containing protein [Kordia jejudonensis]
MPHDSIGWIHTIAALIALLTGSIILANTKGTLLHKQIGRVYGVSMIVVCVTSFMIYRVHNSIGILHFFALVSTVTLLLGMLPLYIKGFKNPIMNHLAWMYWSVIGLYCAFAAEIFTRFPMIFDIKNTYGIFYMFVGISAGLVGMIGGIFFKKKKIQWQEQFGQ